MLGCLFFAGFVNTYASQSHGSAGPYVSGGARVSAPAASVSLYSKPRTSAPAPKAPAPRTSGYHAAPGRVYDTQRHPYRPDRPGRYPLYPVNPVFSGGFWGYGSGDYYLFNNGIWWWEYPYESAYAVEQADCEMETLRSTDGTNHDILVCRQSDGSYQVVADADNLTDTTPAPVKSKTIVVTPPVER